MSGLQGSGKTTFSGKLANLLKTKKNKKPLLAACDVYRPAAIEQLRVVGEQVGVPVYMELENKNPVEIAMNAIREARAKGNDVVIVDTAGRLAIDEQMMKEIAAIKSAIQPDETLFVVDSMTGQDAVNTAKEFNERLDFDGVVLTKLDGDTRGGAALSIRAVTGKPIKFVGQGEKMEDLDVFHPDRMASRILGMGDMLTLIEKTQKEFDEKQAAEMSQKIRENTFDFNDFLDQMNQVQSMGPIEDIVKMIPGMANNPALKNINVDPKDIEHTKAIVYSMTKQERENPDILNPSRRRRIAAGSGRPVVEVNRMIKQFNQMKKMMNQMSKGNFGPMEGMFGNGIKGKLSKMAMNSMVKRNKKNKKKRMKKNKKRK